MLFFPPRFQFSSFRYLTAPTSVRVARSQLFTSVRLIHTARWHEKLPTCYIRHPPPPAPSLYLWTYNMVSRKWWRCCTPQPSLCFWDWKINFRFQSSQLLSKPIGDKDIQFKSQQELLKLYPLIKECHVEEILLYLCIFLAQYESAFTPRVFLVAKRLRNHSFNYCLNLNLSTQKKL
jgi:hypothetical protein